MPDIVHVKFVLVRFSHFNIAIAYANSTFCGSWTQIFFMSSLGWKLSKFQQNEHTSGNKYLQNAKLVLVVIFQTGLFIICAVIFDYHYAIKKNSYYFLGCAHFPEFWLKNFEFHILWSLSSFDLQVFVRSLEISAKRAHHSEMWRRAINPVFSKYIFVLNFVEFT